MKTELIATRKVGDIYTGKTAIVYLVYDTASKSILEVYPNGYNKSCIPLANDAEEASWLLINHPIPRKHYNHE